MSLIEQSRPVDASGSTVNGPPERTVEETIALHRDEWILMKVTGFDEDGWPEKGFVLAHSPRRGDISDALAKEPPRSERAPGGPLQLYYVVNAFPRAR